MGTRSAVARFLNFYPQYTLADLEEMSPADYHWLYGGMLDVLNPDHTDPPEVRMRRRVEEAHRAALAKLRRR